MAGLQTEFAFTLPKGYVDDVGRLHRHGVMRLATARDEIEPLRSTSIEGSDDPYLTVLVLARVVTELGSLDTITPDTIVGLFAADLAFLQDLYGIINFGNPRDVAALQATVEPDDEPEPEEAPSTTANSYGADQVAPDDDPYGPVDAAPSAGADDHSAGALRPSPARSRARIEEVRRAAAP